MDEYADIIVLDEDDFDEDELRNASRDHRSTVRSRFGGRSRRRRPTAAVVRSRGTRVRRSPTSNAGPVVRRDTGGLSYGTLVDAGAQVLAAIQPLPAPPVATGKVETDVSNGIGTRVVVLRAPLAPACLPIEPGGVSRWVAEWSGAVLAAAQVLQSLGVVPLGEMLRVARDEIADRWLERVRREVEYPSDTEAQLLDELPEFLDGLGEALRRREERESEEVAGPARSHGIQRYALGYDIDNLLREYAILYRVIRELAGERGDAITPEEQAVLVQQLFDAAIGSAVYYVRERDVQYEQQAARHYSFIAHELRNPLQTALLAAGALERGPHPTARVVARLHRALEQLRHLIDDTLIDALLRGDREPQRQDVLVEDLVDSVVRDVRFEALERGVEIRTEIAAALTVRWDSKLMHSALSNLVRNAVKFTCPRSDVILRAGREGDVIRVAVEDRCGGLPDDYEDLVEAHVQKGLDRSGYGLGLAIAKQAAAAHGGRLEAHNHPGGGCVFVLTIPAGPPAQEPRLRRD